MSAKLIHYMRNTTRRKDLWISVWRTATSWLRHKRVVQCFDASILEFNTTVNHRRIMWDGDAQTDLQTSREAMDAALTSTQTLIATWLSRRSCLIVVKSTLTLSSTMFPMMIQAVSTNPLMTLTHQWTLRTHPKTPTTTSNLMSMMIDTPRFCHVWTASITTSNHHALTSSTLPRLQITHS